MNRLQVSIPVRKGEPLTLSAEGIIGIGALVLLVLALLVFAASYGKLAGLS
jgi:hypothetical protein